MPVVAVQKQLALDTNILMNLADGVDAAHDFREQVQAKGYALYVPHTVSVELQQLTVWGGEREKTLAATALTQMLSWKLKPFTISLEGLRLASEFARRLVEHGLLPPGEMNDG